MPPLFSQDEVEERLRELTHWKQEGKAIVRAYRFPSFKEAMAFVNRVAEDAEGINHHPDITINYNRVVLSITTHSEGGLTRRDFRLAGLIDKLES